MRDSSRLRIRTMSLWVAVILAAALPPLDAHPSGFSPPVAGVDAANLPVADDSGGDSPVTGATATGPPASAVAVPAGPSSDAMFGATNDQGVAPEVIPTELDEAVRMVFSDFRVRAQYEYVMTGKVRILLFWFGRDDVGDGYISVEEGIARSELSAIRLKIGSDPDKAPRRINRWGAAAEVVERDVPSSAVLSTAFFGFMKATEGASVDAVEAELASEGPQQRHVFEASINRIGPTVALSSVLPIVSNVDFHSGQLTQAEQMVRDQYERAFRVSSYRRLNGEGRKACERSASFLFTLKEVVDDAVAGRPAGDSRCFVYNSKLYTLTLAGQRPRARMQTAYELVDGTEVQHDYNDLIEMEFESRNQLTGWTEDFNLVVGTSGNLRGVPVQITYQPNFWFKAILNLHRATAAPPLPDAGSK